MLILWYIYYVLTVELIMKYTTPERCQSRYVSFSVQKYHNCSLFWNTHQIYSFDYACYQFIMENMYFCISNAYRVLHFALNINSYAK